MATITKPFKNFDIHIDPTRKIITVKQRWQYNWLLPPQDLSNRVYNWITSKGLSDWTYIEKKIFHNKVNAIINARWSGNYYSTSSIKSLKKNRNSNNLNPYENTEFKINFDIEWVTSNAHWTVNVKKIPDGAPQHNSSVKDWSNEINLGSSDTRDVKMNFNTKFKHNTLSHEFGHTINAGDEYGEDRMAEEHIQYYLNHPNKIDVIHKRFKYRHDLASTMNIGVELRNRFISNINSNLNEMIRGVQFKSYLSDDYVNSIGGLPA